MLSASQIILEYACPAAGAVTATVMFAAPLRDAYRAACRGSLGDLNPTPWAFMLGNCFGWVTYGVLIRNLFVYLANAPGFLLAVWLNLIAVQLLSRQDAVVRQSLVAVSRQETTRQESIQDPKEEATDNNNDDDYEQLIARIQYQHARERTSARHEILVVLIVTIWLALDSIVAFADSWSSTTKEGVVGVAVNLNLVFFYGAPLSTIWTVLTTQSSASIHIPTMLTNTANGVFWFAYGVAVRDYFIMIPNGLGALLGVVQLVLRVVFPANRQSGKSSRPSGTTTTAAVSLEMLESSPTTVR